MNPIANQTPLADSNFTTRVIPLKSKKLLAAELGISVKTLSRRLKKASVELPKGFICSENQLLIYKIIATK